MEQYDLSPDELREAQRVINSTRPGRYILSKLFGSDWRKIDSPTKFGRGFAKAVSERRLTGISIHPEKTGANAVQYEVHHR